MTNEDTQHLISMVEEQTGYRVIIGTSDIQTADAQMISAQVDHPVHMINVSTRCLANADYITAGQCQMLLLMWSHPNGVPKLVPRQDAFRQMLDKVAAWKKYASLPRHAVLTVAEKIVTGVIHQLSSTPTELLAIEACYRDCPSLREQQKSALYATFRNNTQALRPENKDMIPPNIFESNTAMCAAVALLWGRLSGDTVALVPYKALGIEGNAKNLLDLFDATAGSPAERRVATVDAWAKALNLSHLYDWRFHPK